MHHDSAYHAAEKARAGWLTNYVFDTDEREGGNGIWAIADTSISEVDAVRRIKCLSRGCLPPGIRATADAAAAELLRRWEAGRD
jgi:hypothetical protein